MQRIIQSTLEEYFFASNGTFIKEYIHNYNPSIRIMTYLLAPLMLCELILYISGGTDSLKSTSQDRFSRKLFIALYLLSRVLNRISSAKEYIFNFSNITNLQSGLDG